MGEGRGEHPCLLPKFREKAFSFSQLNMMLTGFVVNNFYYVEICSLYTRFDESFHHEWMLNLSSAFSASIEMIM